MMRRLNPLRLLQTDFAYQRVPSWSAGADSVNGSPFETRRRWPAGRSWERLRVFNRVSLTKLLRLAVYGVVVTTLVIGLIVHSVRHGWWGGKKYDHRFYWQEFSVLDGYFSGVRNLVLFGEYEAQNTYNKSVPLEVEKSGLEKMPALDPVVYDPYPKYMSAEYLDRHQAVEKCFLDVAGAVPPPDVYVYPGLPQYLPQPLYGSYSELGIRDDICFDRFGRYGPYGYSYDDNLREHGLRTKATKKDKDLKHMAGSKSEKVGVEKVFDQAAYTNWTGVDWGTAQQRCVEKNKARFSADQPGMKERVQRHAYVLRTWTGHKYNQHTVLAIRAMINELALKSGGEYDVHMLVQVRDTSIPIWADDGIYRETLEAAVPREFWNITTLWSEQQMKMYYPEPFAENFANMVASSVHGVYRSAHFALQWFSQQHPEYDFFWNWEMDVRYTGHYYELNSQVSEWAKKQPRKGLWERSRRFWFPNHHGSYQNFTSFVEQEINILDKPNNNPSQSGPVPIWGPFQSFKNYGILDPPANTTPPTSYDKDDYTWGVGEDADLIVFNPIFDPSQTNWVFRTDVTGYNTSLPIPPRRAAIITVARLSRRLLDTMHHETWAMKHTMFPEMWAPTVCMHHGLKAVYAPHPVYFDRDWELGYMDRVFNYPDGIHASPFGWGEHNLIGSTFYYNAGFAGRLWRRWLGFEEEEEGGRGREERGTGRMCLRGTLVHPVKFEWGEGG